MDNSILKVTTAFGRGSKVDGGMTIFIKAKDMPKFIRYFSVVDVEEGYKIKRKGKSKNPSSCPSCGAPLGLDDKFCNYCNTVMR